jgi:STE24 endopeptidase
MFIVVVAILSVVLTFPEPVWRAVTAPGMVMASAAAATLLPPTIALFTARRTIGLLERDPHWPGRGQAAFGRGNLALQALLAVGHGLLLLVTDFLRLIGGLPVVGRWPVVPAVLAVVPFLLSVVLSWLFLYPADRAVRQIALEVYLFRGRPVRPVWTLRQYLAHNLRHQLLFVLVPMLLIVAARDVILLFEEKLIVLTGHPYIADILLGSSAAAVALVAPGILRHIWSTRRLPDGPLRRRLEAVCRLLGLRYREILLWRAGGLVANAAVMGVFAPLRYILITDGLIEQLEDVKIEAVFGHEAGHVKRHHILFFLLFALISGCAVTIFSLRTRQLDPGSLEFAGLAVAVGAGLLVKWTVVFGWLSRRFERQADMFSTRVLALAGLPCAGPCAFHHGASNPAASPLSSAALCRTAAALFGDTLHEVAVLNGLSPQARSWRHGSISERCRTLLGLALDPPAAARAERTVQVVKLIILLTAIGFSLWTAWELRIWQFLAR